VTTARGVTWGYRIVHTRTEKGAVDANEIQDCETGHDVELVRRDRAGTKAVAGANETLTYDAFTRQNDIALLALTDYDGDGEIEILRVHDALQREGSLEHEATVLTFKNGTVTAYPPAAKLKIEGHEDVDGDGREDLLSRGPYEKVGPNDAFGNGWSIVSALFAYHASPDGSFALGDDASMAYTRRHCPAPTKDVTLTLDDTTGAREHEKLADELACARLWGVPPQKVEHAWDAVCRDFDAEVDPFACQTWPKDLAAVAPPFTLR